MDKVEDAAELESGEEDLEDGQAEGGADFAMLQRDGPQESAGSGGHPDNCTPCTFYCFTRRGCNRASECKFCHLSHQSKLQQRREDWKKQQREKRKSARENAAMETMTRRSTFLAGSHNAQAARAFAPEKPAEAVRPQLASRSAVAQGRPFAPPGQNGKTNGSGILPSLAFTYTPSRVTLTMGQHTEIRPALFGATATRQFYLLAPLPRGLYFNPMTGVIAGAAFEPIALETITVEVEMMDGRRACTGIEIEVVDFTRGGYVVGHISEAEPGRFMLVVYKPDDAEPEAGGMPEASAFGQAGSPLSDEAALMSMEKAMLGFGQRKGPTPAGMMDWMMRMRHQSP